MRPRALSLLAAALVLASCGGGDDDATADPAAGADVPAADDDGSSGGSESDAGDDGAFALTADPVDVSGVDVPATPAPRSAIVVVDGVTIEFDAIGSAGYRCTATPELVEIEMSGVSVDGMTNGRFSMRAEPADGGWFGTGAFEHPDVEHTDIYVDRAEIAVDGSVVTYRGPLVPRQEFGQVDVADRLGAIVVDCGSGEFRAVADVGDGPISLPIGESQRFDCFFGDDRFEYRVAGGVFPDTVEVSIDGRVDGDGWIGTAVVDTGDDRYVGVVSGAAVDASADGVAWSGEGTHTSDADPSVDETVTMSISIPCG